jgi:hypothetical protein
MFRLKKRDQFPPSEMDFTTMSSERSVIALDIQTKYQFCDTQGQVIHEYHLPGSPEIQNCGGYVDKLIKYRDPSLLEHLRVAGISKESFNSPAFPILATRSPQLDLLLFTLIRDIRIRTGDVRVSLFDHGCSVAEHFDLLDVMLQAVGPDRARDVLHYIGLDISALLLSAARLLHSDVKEEHFQLIRAEGSSVRLPERAFDLALTVGVINHVADPSGTIKQLLQSIRCAAVMALWVTMEENGFYAINHSGNSTYFFSRNDLADLKKANPDGRFLVADFIPERQSSQRRSYVGIDETREDTLGCYHLVFTRLDNDPFDLSEMVF